MGGVKKSAVLDVGYPIYAAKFINNKTVLVAGGGGEGNNGIPNKITVVKCFFKSSDKTKILQKFREITLPKNEDSPMCLDIAKDSAVDDGSFSVFVGCNQSTQLIQSMNINNNLRKYAYSKDEHLRFLDAAQLDVDDDVLSTGTGAAANAGGDYPKIVHLSSNNSIGCFMTSKLPSTIYVFDPEVLDTKFKYQAQDKTLEIKDFHLSPEDGGKTICYITSKSTIETVSTITANPISSSSTNQKTHSVLSKYILSKIKYVDNAHVLVSATGKPGSGASGISLFLYRLTDHSIIRQKVISTKIKGVTGIDLSVVLDLVALAGNDTSLTIVRLSDFKTIQVFKKLHAFAITRLAFSPNGTSLASVSAANSLHVMKLQPNYAKSRSTIGTIFNYLFTILLVALLAIGLQKGYENGQLETALELLQEYGLKSIKLTREYVELGVAFVKNKWIEDDSSDSDGYFKVDEWTDDHVDPRDLTISSDHIILTSETAIPETGSSSTVTGEFVIEHSETLYETQGYSSEDYISAIQEQISSITETLLTDVAEAAPEETTEFSPIEEATTEVVVETSSLPELIVSTSSSVEENTKSSAATESATLATSTETIETLTSLSESTPSSSDPMNTDINAYRAPEPALDVPVSHGTNVTDAHTEAVRFHDPEDEEAEDYVVVEEYILEDEPESETSDFASEHRLPEETEEEDIIEIIEEIEEEEPDYEPASEIFTELGETIVDTSAVETSELAESATSEVVIEYVTTVVEIEDEINSNAPTPVETVVIEVTEYATENAEPVHESTESDFPQVPSDATAVVDKLVNPVIEKVQEAADPVVEKVAEVVEKITKPVLDNIVQPVVDQINNYGIDVKEEISEAIEATETTVTISETSPEETTESVTSIAEGTQIIESALEYSSYVPEVVDSASKLALATEAVIENAGQASEVASKLSEHTTQAHATESIEFASEVNLDPAVPAVESYAELARSAEAASSSSESVSSEFSSSQSLSTPVAEESSGSVTVTEDSQLANPVLEKDKQFSESVPEAVKQRAESISSEIEQIVEDAVSAKAEAPTKSKKVRTTTRTIKRVKKTNSPSAPVRDEL